MFSKQLVLLVVSFMGIIHCYPSTNSSLIKSSKQQKFFTNPILDELAGDPCVVKLNGMYYMVYTQGDKIDILKSPTLSNFRGAERSQAYVAPPGRSNLWAPELHLIQGNIYIYFTMDDGIADENHRMYVIKANDPNNPMGTWGQEVR
jgi:GH43 family beta-xylosidase